MHTFIILNPGHFHAALVLRQSHPFIRDDIYVYSEKGADLDRFMQMARLHRRQGAWRSNMN